MACLPPAVGAHSSGRIGGDPSGIPHNLFPIVSLVGQRPHAVEHNELYRRQIPGYMQRHAYKPGITGLAQIEGWRGETSTVDAMALRIDADLRYQRNWSLKLDIKILIKTLLHLRYPNAY